MLQAFAGGRLFGESYGEQPPRVVGLHGWGRTHSDLAAVLRDLDAVAFDLPGFGATPPPPEAWGTPEYASAIAETIDQPVVVLGHSLGGRIAVHLAARHPEKVRALVITGAPLFRSSAAGKPALRYRVARALNRRGVVSDARLEALRQQYGSADYKAAQGVMRDVHVRVVNESYDDAISGVRCPAELVWGDDDTEAPVSIAHELKGRWPDARLTVCPGAGHMTPQTVPGELRAAVERHL
jgi:pimeloyl-ACP methyl ester carboxylesterase